jgi:hypothetical protein
VSVIEHETQNALRETRIYVTVIEHFRSFATSITYDTARESVESEDEIYIYPFLSGRMKVICHHDLYLTGR